MDYTAALAPATGRRSSASTWRNPWCSWWTECLTTIARKLTWALGSNGTRRWRCLVCRPASKIGHAAGQLRWNRRWASARQLKS